MMFLTSYEEIQENLKKFKPLRDAVLAGNRWYAELEKVYGGAAVYAQHDERGRATEKLRQLNDLKLHADKVWMNEMRNFER
jgi:hypothetical protein